MCAAPGNRNHSESFREAAPDPSSEQAFELCHHSFALQRPRLGAIVGAASMVCQLCGLVVPLPRRGYSTSSAVSRSKRRQD